jgi:hypothetical protein
MVPKKHPTTPFALLSPASINSRQYFSFSSFSSLPSVQKPGGRRCAILPLAAVFGGLGLEPVRIEAFQLVNKHFSDIIAKIGPTATSQK